MADESERIVGLYQRHADAWARDRGKVLSEQRWLDRFLALVPEPRAVLDIGCGPGEPIARYLAACGCAVTGVDSSPRMIEMCRGALPAQTWVIADMRELALGRAFDGILAWDSFFHLKADDQRRMFPIFGRHAAPEAPLMFTSGPQHGVAMGTYQDEPLYHASLAPDEYRALLRDSGFALVDFVPEDPDCGGHTVWLAQRA